MAKCMKCASEDLRIKRDNGGSYGMNQLPLGKGRNAAVAQAINVEAVVAASHQHVVEEPLDPPRGGAPADLRHRWSSLRRSCRVPIRG